MNTVLVAHGHNSIELFHSLTPLYLLSISSKNFKINFIHSNKLEKNSENFDLLIIVRKYKDLSYASSLIENEVTKYRKRFKKIIYFDDSAGAGSIRFDIVHLFDSYWKRSLYKDKNNYNNSHYGGQLFSHYYSKKYCVKDNYPLNSQVSNDESLFQRVIKVAWNIGCGLFPISSNIFSVYTYVFLRKLSVALNYYNFDSFQLPITKHYNNNIIRNLAQDFNVENKVHTISARYPHLLYSNSIGWQRRHSLKLHNTSMVTGTISKHKYLNELRTSYAVFSPYGWGEICYRDFEAIMFGCLLIKPDMSHIETWPNIYKNEFYVSVDWDLEDLNVLDIRDLFNDNYYQKVYAVRKHFLNDLDALVYMAEKLLMETVDDNI